MPKGGRRTILDYANVVLTWSDVSGKTSTADQAIDAVRRFHRESMLAVLIRLNLALTHLRPLSQADALERWAPGLRDDAAVAMRAKGASHIFTEPQILNLIRLAILFASPTEGRRCDRAQDFEALAALLLMMSDLYEGQATGPGARATIFANVTRTELFLRNDRGYPDITARNYDLFARLPRWLHHQRGGHGFDLPATFREITGLDVEDFLGLGFGLLAQYDTMDADILGDAPIGVARTYFDNAHLRPDIRDAMWRLIARPLGAYQEALQEEWDRTTGPARWSAMLTFSQWPVIEFPTGSLVPVSRRLLKDRVTHGIYWILANALGGKERQRFTNFFGEVFEEYVQRCFRRALGRAFLSKGTYGPERRPLIDGALTTPRSLGLCECKARRLLLNVLEAGREADLIASVEESLDEAAGQIADAIRAGQTNNIHDFAARPDTRYYPIVVTYEALPTHNLAVQVYEEIIHRGDRLAGDRIKPVSLMSARDVETIEALIIEEDIAWPDFLTRKHSERYRGLSFHNYAFEVTGRRLPRNRYLHARWQRVNNIIGERLFGQPLSPEGG